MKKVILTEAQFMLALIDASNWENFCSEDELKNLPLIKAKANAIEKILNRYKNEK